MSINVSEFVWHRLSEWGLKRVYGYPGDGVGGLDVALEKAKDFMEYVQVRHEEMAAFMASAHAKFTGAARVFATPPPARARSTCSTAFTTPSSTTCRSSRIVGQQARTALGAYYQQEVDLQNLFKDVASEFVGLASVPEQVRHLIDRAVRIAPHQARRHLRHPAQRPAGAALRGSAARPRRHAYRHRLCRPGEVAGPGSCCSAAADVLNGGKKVAMLVGAGALDATDEVIAVAERLQAGVAKALLGKAALPDDLPFVTGSIGLLGTKPSWDLMKGCDTLLMVGSAFPTASSCPKPGARARRADRHRRQQAQPALPDGSQHGRRQRRRPCARCCRCCSRRPTPPGATRSREVCRPGGRRWKTRAMDAADPLNPQRVFWELSPRLPDNAHHHRGFRLGAPTGTRAT